MSCVAEAKAAMMNNISVNENMPMGVCPEAMVSCSGWGRLTVSTTMSTVSKACMERIHQRLVFTTSTMGLQIPFRNQGK